MLEDRDYMRQPEPYELRWLPRLRLRWSWTILLLAAYTAVFIAQLVANHFDPGNPVFNTRLAESNAGVSVEPGWLPLSAEGLARGFVWQLVTYQFLHAGWLHLILNGWAIFVFGRVLEDLLGGKKFLSLVFSSGIVGGVFQVLVALLWPQYFGGPVVGASACAFGLVAAFATLFPERELTLLLFYVFPVQLRAKTLLYGSAALAFAGFALPTLIMPGTAHVAHLGGMAMGWFFVRKILQGDWSRLEGFLHPFRKSSARRPAGETFAVTESDSVDSEVDSILDKISAHGIQSLTPRERAVLEAARKKMAQR
jgi:membrane associated rhomboid family serine protease